MKLLTYMLRNYSKQTISGLNKQQVLEMLSLTKKEIILFDIYYSIQIDGVALDSPLSSTLENIIPCHLETRWLQNCPKAFQPGYCKRYVNYIFFIETRTCFTV